MREQNFSFIILHSNVETDTITLPFAFVFYIKATGNTPIEYAQRVKIEAAKKAFETNRKNVNEVMYLVGYSNVKAFREVFPKITGLLPLEYRSRYNSEILN